MRPRVFIVDDDEAMRASLSRFLRAAGLEVKTFEDGAAFLEHCDGNIQGCVLLDLAMPEMTGQEVHEAMLARGIDSPVIFLTGHGDIPAAVQALHRGAFDFLEKPTAGNRLLERVRAALRMAEQRREEVRIEREIRARCDRLSPREQEVLALLVQGLPNKKIALRLGISPRTVESHRSRVMDKMMADNLLELAAIAARCRSSNGDAGCS